MKAGVVTFVPRIRFLGEYLHFFCSISEKCQNPRVEKYAKININFIKVFDMPTKRR